ncbi:hypothetical protein FRC08_016080 [Ceratobasidium sp. 394]|nr:hypothetical protein FRC08_016080 [Ceratobasidium sp. 394]
MSTVLRSGGQTPVPQHFDSSGNPLVAEPTPATHTLSSPDSSLSDQRAAKRQVVQWQPSGAVSSPDMNLMNLDSSVTNANAFFDSIQAQSYPQEDALNMHTPAAPNNMHTGLLPQLFAVPGLPGFLQTADGHLFSVPTDAPQGGHWPATPQTQNPHGAQGYYTPATPTPGLSTNMVSQLASSPSQPNIQSPMPLPQPLFFNPALTHNQPAFTPAPSEPVPSESAPSEPASSKQAPAQPVVNQTPGAYYPVASSVASAPTTNDSASHRHKIFTHEPSQTTHSYSQSSLSSTRRSKLATLELLLREDFPDNPLVLSEQQQMEELNSSQPEAPWRDWENNKLIHSILGRGAPATWLDEALKTDRSTSADAAVPPMWFEIKSVVFFDRREVGLLIAQWWSSVDTFNNTLSLQQFFQRKGTAAPQIRVIIADGPQLASRIEEARNAGAVSSKLNVHDVQVWMDRRNGWLTLMLGRYVYPLPPCCHAT